MDRPKSAGSVIVVEEVEKREKEIEDVKVQIDGCTDVLVVVVAFDQIICVVDDVPTEYDCCHSAIYRSCKSSKRENKLHSRLPCSDDDDANYR